MIDAAVKALAQAPNYATVATVMPDGLIQNQVLWVDADDTHILINTEVGRQRYRNVVRDNRMTVTIFENGNWYHWAEVRGRVDEIVTGSEARAHIDALSMKYTGAPYGRPIQTERVILKLRPERQLVYPS
ncbi:MAG: TIGR03618 family F420-dependent PPOX class oxidoreductase [Acidimicrobiia bacterium]